MHAGNVFLGISSEAHPVLQGPHHAGQAVPVQSLCRDINRLR